MQMLKCVIQVARPLSEREKERERSLASVMVWACAAKISLQNIAKMHHIPVLINAWRYVNACF